MHWRSGRPRATCFSWAIRCSSRRSRRARIRRARGASVLEHLLGDAATIPPARGVFLERTRRMHPDVCRFVSEVVYDGRLHWEPEPAMERQATAFGTGLRFVPVEHV